MQEVKYKEIDIMDWKFMTDRNMMFSKEFAKYFPKSFPIENIPDFADISICRQRPYLNDSLQVTIEELRGEIKAMKNERSSGPGRNVLELMKYVREYLDKYQLLLVIIWNRTKPKQWTISYVT